MKNFNKLNWVHGSFIFILGFAAFILQLRMLYVMRYLRIIAILGNTMTRSASNMLSVGIIFLVIFFATVSFLYIEFGSLIYQFRSFVQTASSATMLGFNGFDDFVVEAGRFAVAVVIIYVMTIMFIVTNLFVAILDEFLSEMAEDREIHKDNEVIDYVLSLFKELLPGQHEETEGKIGFFV